MNPVYNYLILMNIITFICYGVDKYKAINKKRRISEVTLYFLGLIGGAVGAIIAMLLFRHKTRKFKFWFLNVFFIIMWILLLWRFR